MSSTHSDARSVDPLLLCDRRNIRISAHSRDRRLAIWPIPPIARFPAHLPPSLPTFGGVGRKGQPTSVYFSGRGREGDQQSCRKFAPSDQSLLLEPTTRETEADGPRTRGEKRGRRQEGRPSSFLLLSLSFISAISSAPVD